jgi:hypothetical protein
MEMDKSLFEKIGDDKDTLVVEVGAGEEPAAEMPEEPEEKKAAGLWPKEQDSEYDAFFVPKK